MADIRKTCLGGGWVTCHFHILTSHHWISGAGGDRGNPCEKNSSTPLLSSSDSCQHFKACQQFQKRCLTLNFNRVFLTRDSIIWIFLFFKHHVIAHELASEAPCHINTIFWGDRVKHKLARSQFRMQCLSKAIYSQFCPHYARELQGSTKWCQICWSSMLEKSWKGKYETLFSTHQVSTTFALITADKSTKSQVFPLTWRKLFQFHPDWWLETPNGARSLTPHAWLPSWWKGALSFIKSHYPLFY